MEGTTKETNFVVTDAARVGELPTQAAFAVHYNKKMDQFILPETKEEIVTLAKQHKIKYPNIYTFLYDGTTLINNSSTISSELKYNE